MDIWNRRCTHAKGGPATRATRTRSRTPATTCNDAPALHMRHTAAGWPAAELLEEPCGLAEQRAPTAVRVFGLTSLWYLSAIVALVTAKLSVSALRAPLLLCASQFTTATALTSALLRMHESPPPKVLPPSAACSLSPLLHRCASACTAPQAPRHARPPHLCRRHRRARLPRSSAALRPRTRSALCSPTRRSRTRPRPTWRR